MSPNTKHTGQQPESPIEDYMRRLKCELVEPERYRTILDVGGGDGSVWKYEKRPVLKDIVEPDETLRNIARMNNVYCGYVSDVEEVIHDIYLYDAVTILGVLEHLDDPAAFLENFYDAKEIILTVPNARSLHRFSGVILGQIDRLESLHEGDLAIGHKRVWSNFAFQDFLKPFCEKHGYDMWSTTYGFKPLSYGQLVDANVSWEEFKAMNSAAKIAGILDDGYGAETFVRLTRKVKVL